MLRLTLLNSIVPKYFPKENYTPFNWYSDGYRHVEPKTSTCSNDADCKAYSEYCDSGYCVKLPITFDTHGLFRDDNFVKLIRGEQPFYNQYNSGAINVNNIDPEVQTVYGSTTDAEDDMDEAND